MARRVSDVVLAHENPSECDRVSHFSRMSSQFHASLATASASTAAIQANVRRCRWQEAVLLWQNALGTKPPISRTAVNLLLSALQRISLWQQVLALLASLPARRLAADKTIYHAALLDYAANRSWQLALNVASLMMAPVTPDVVNYNSLITTCLGSSSWQLAVHVLAHMPVSPDSISFSSAIRACEKSTCWKEAVALLFGMIEREMLPSGISCGSALNACKRGNRWQHMVALLNLLQDIKAPPDGISYTATIAACAADSWQNSLSVFDRMQKQQVLPDVISFSSAAHACGAHGYWEQALAICSSMRQFLLQPNAVLYSSLISACSAGGEWQRAFALFTQMRAQSLQIDVFACGAAINACTCEGAMWEEALRLLDSMLQATLRPNKVCCNAAISACDKGGQWQLALGFFRKLGTWTMHADAVSYGAAISACAQGHEWRMALTLLDEMPASSTRRNTICYTSALSALDKAGHWQLVLLMLSQMSEEALQPTLASYGAAMSACDSAGAWTSALTLLHQMKSQRLMPTGMIAGSLAGAVQQGMGEDAALDMLAELRDMFTEQCPHAACALGPADAHPVAVVGFGPGIVATAKPSGERTEDLAESLAESLGCELTLVSRLDHPTSGVLPVALGSEDSAAANWLQAQFAGRMVHKEYLCLVEGRPLGAAGYCARIDAPLHTIKKGDQLRTEISSLGREAKTQYQVLARYRLDAATDRVLSLLSVRPRTGRTHQIRVHMASIGAPIVGDLTYGRKQLSTVPWFHRSRQIASGVCLNFIAMFFTLCRDLHDLFQKDDLELSFWPNDAEGNLSHRREPAACKYGGYDPVADDYEMITMPAEPGDCDEEKNMIQRQIASLSSRIARGGAQEVLDHYHKVKEDLELQLAMPGILRYKTMDVSDVDLRSTLSTISTCDTFPDEPTCIPLDLEPAGVQPSSTCQLLASEASTVVEGSDQ
eukprot:s287_g11.t7